MLDEDRNSALHAIAALGVPKDLSHIPLTGALYCQEMGGPEISTYWSGPEVAEQSNLIQKQRGEMFLVVNSVLSLAHLYARASSPGRHQEFDFTFLFFLKGFAQTAASVNLLCGAGCYLDALALIRSLASRVNLLALFALAPHLFDEWLIEPKDKCFSDGNVRKELSSHGITIFPHFYKQFSEVIHSQYQAVGEAGYMQKGLFPKVVSIENQILVASKLLFGVIGNIGLSVLALCPRPEIREELKEEKRLFAFFVHELLPPNRFDHLFTTIAKERHWKKTSKKQEEVIGEWFDLSIFRRQLDLFSQNSPAMELGNLYKKGITRGQG
ncbi:hypothetical protein ACTRXD_10355 [Nitrospira sp. T9]|uniref:hypothetical protein n=1 Tax=unclassified Nitrospira TaxID=2652172 RepID=UPI003F996920